MPADIDAQALAALDDASLMQRLERALDDAGEGRDMLDVSALDGYLCGVLLQPRPVRTELWLSWIIDPEQGLAPTAPADAALRSLALERHARLDRAIVRRDWFDPWVFELDGPHTPSEVVAPWVAGFGLAVDVFPGLMQLDESRLLEPLALLYRHLEPEDLEDADALIEHIESLEPPRDTPEVVEELVRATLLLADISRPRESDRAAPARRPAAGPSRPRGPARGAPRRR